MCLDFLYDFFCKRSKDASLPSFADNFLNISHEFDEELVILFDQITIPTSLSLYNPDPEDEPERFRSLSLGLPGKMLQKNILLASRVFITNADVCGLANQFAKNDTVRILDIGCGNALNLLGILALFRNNKIEYLGVDIDEVCINECELTYGKLENVSFRNLNALELFNDHQNHTAFDLVLMQHPNLVDRKQSRDFKILLTKSKELLKDQGILYCTLYHDIEAELFQKELLEQLFGGNLYHSTVYKTVQLVSENSGARFAPEQFIFMSDPKGFILEMPRSFNY